MKVGFSGQRGAYSEAAAAAIFRFDIATVPLPSINAVFDALAKRELTHGVVPVEKTPSGFIADTFLRLKTAKLFITHSAILRTSYVLAAAPGAELASLKRIHAHPHAMTACEGFLRGLKGIELVPTFEFGSVETSLMERRTKDDAVLCSSYTALRRGLAVLNPNCNTLSDAITRYVALAPEPRDPEPEEGQPLTTVMFDLEDRPGALMRKLAVLAELGLNMVRLKMFPDSAHPGRSTVFLTYGGRYSDPASGRALEIIQTASPTARHLGSYVVRDAR